MRRSCCSAALLAAVTGLLVLPALLGPVAPPVLWNLSASVPEGLYVRAGDRLAGGGLATVCLPADLGRFARERGYVSRGRCPGDAAPLFKRLAARGGQEIDYLDASIWIDGRPLAGTTIRQLDRKGRPLPLARAFPYRLALGEVFLLGEDPFSFDSRYFGPLPETAVLGVYRAFWTPGGPRP